MLFALLMGMLSGITNVHAMDVNYLTQSGVVPLKTWSVDDLKKLAKRNGEISAQKLLLEDSAEKLELNDRANIDLVTLIGDHTARVPRFMIWREYLKLKLNSDGTLSASAVKTVSGRLLVPTSLFSVNKITRVELQQAALFYPEIELHSRTNPAASRGEKLYEQSCLACHGISAAPLKVAELSDSVLKSFSNKHGRFGIALDARALRGLVSYRDTLVLEHSEVKSAK